jgi:hypothetical protein
LVSRFYLEWYSSNDDWVLSKFDKGFVRNCWYDLLAKHSSWCIWFHFTGLIRMSRIFEETFFDVFEICVRLSWSARLVWLCSVCKELDHWMTDCKCCRLKSMQWCKCSIWALRNADRSRPNSCLLGDGSGAQQQQHCANSDRLAKSTTRMQPTFVMKIVLSMFSL